MISPGLQRAYCETSYVARGVGIVVRVGRRNAAMDMLLCQHGARAAVFITAWNPRSQRMPAGWNDRMNRRLRCRLRRWVVLPADGAWRRWHEAHWLVLAPVAPLRRLGRLFRQNALVIVRSGHPAALRLL